MHVSHDSNCGAPFMYKKKGDSVFDYQTLYSFEPFMAFFIIYITDIF